MFEVALQTESLNLNEVSVSRWVQLALFEGIDHHTVCSAIGGDLEAEK
jgi:hypothetical protein